MSEPTASPPAPVLVITGMHRSGTSFVASLLHDAGLYLGGRMLAPHASNPLGHFEDLEFYEFDRHLLRSHGLSDDGFVSGARVEPGPAFRNQAKPLVAARRALGKPWGWKDPRTALLLDFWDSVIPDARYLFLFREPWDVVDSLYRRGDPVFEANPSLAVEVWMHVNRLLCDFARRHPARVLVREVGQVAADPSGTIEEIRTRLGVPLGEPSTTFHPEWLTAASPDRAALLARGCPACVTLLEELRALGGGPHATNATLPPRLHRATLDHATLDRATLDHALAEWQRVRGLERRARALEVDVAMATTRANDAETVSREAECQLHNAQRLMMAAEQEVTTLTESGHQLAGQLDAARAHARQLESAGMAAAADRDRTTAAQAERIAALEATVAELTRSTSWRVTSPLRTAVRLTRSHGRPFVHRLVATGRFVAGRLSSPAAIRRSFARGLEILSRDGPTGLVRAVQTARRLDEHRSGPAHSPHQPVVRMPLAPPRPLPPARRPVVPGRPLISIVMPVFDTPAEVLDATIQSVLDQSASNWELVAVDDASPGKHIAELLARHAAREPRIRVHRRATNGGIAAATNDGVARAVGEFVAFLDHDDLLAPDAVARCGEALASTSADALYTDQDTVDDRGRTSWIFHKPDWSPEYLRHVMYVGHLLVVRRSLAERLGFRSEFDGVQDFEFMLRLGEATPAVAHLPEVLYHWRAVAGSLAAASDAKRGIDERQARAVQDHLDRLGVPAVASPHPRFPHRCVVTPKLVRFPKVSIVIPTKDRPDLLGPCLDSVLGSRYPDLEIVVVDTGTTDAGAVEILHSRPVRVVPFTSGFNFSAASNAGAAAATGEVLVFLNNDTTVISPDWLEHLVFHLVAADVGAVGPLLLYPDGSVQHAGVVLGARGTADHVMRRFPADADGYAGSLSCPREVSAVTGACLAIRRDAFVRVGGWNELYATHYQDVDLCLRLRRAGLRIIFTPDARLTHHESPSRGDRYDLLDRLLLIDTWKDELAAGDSAYPAACSLERLDYSPRDPALEVCRA